MGIINDTRLLPHIAVAGVYVEQYLEYSVVLQYVRGNPAAPDSRQRLPGRMCLTVFVDTAVI